MILINFSHPLTAPQVARVEELAGKPVEKILGSQASFNPRRPFDEQAVALIDRVGLTPLEWQTLPILVRLPSMSEIAAIVLAVLHGRMGYFPPIIRLRKTAADLPPVFEVAELINLQRLRESARETRE